MTIVVSMLLALWWAVGEATGLAHPSLSWMAATHGVANALGFVLCTLLGLRLLPSAPEPSGLTYAEVGATQAGPLPDGYRHLRVRHLLMPGATALDLARGRRRAAALAGARGGARRGAPGRPGGRPRACGS